MRGKKYYTVKEWKKFRNNNYFDMQEMLCKKYEIILTDYKTKSEKILSLLSKINLKNIDKGIVRFNKVLQNFSESMDKVTSEIDSHETKDTQNIKSLWGSSDNSISIWGKTNNHTIWSSDDKHKSNLEKIWGKNYE